MTDVSDPPKKLSNLDENYANEEGLPETAASPGKSPPAGGATRMSVTSQKYDRGGKGYLDANEQRMREMDTSDRGYLTNDKIYGLLERQVEMQQKMVTHKRLIVGLVAFSVVLALANMGTAFAAAKLAKDTTVDADNNLQRADGGGRVGTKMVTETVVVGREQEQDVRRRDQNYDATHNSGRLKLKSKKALDMWNRRNNGETFQLNFECLNVAKVLTIDSTSTCQDSSGSPCTGSTNKNDRIYTFAAGDYTAKIDCPAASGSFCYLTGVCDCYSGDGKSYCDDGEDCCGGIPKCTCALAGTVCIEIACLPPLA